MSYLRDRAFAEAPAPVGCDTEAPFAAIRDFEFDKYAVPAIERVAIERLAETLLHGSVVGGEAWTV
jgi:hypothetical protein